MASFTNSRRGRPRPAWLRALGSDEPPRSLTIDGLAYRRTQVLKHDSWAATAQYRGPRGKVTVKFHRQQPIGLLSMRWLGRILARRETICFQKLADVPGVPAMLGPVMVDDRLLDNAVCHEWVEGAPLSFEAQLPGDFFPRLQKLLHELHTRDMAYVDLHKRENVLVGDDGQPYLFDFQISYLPPVGWLGRTWLIRRCLQLAQRGDDYHLLKLHAKVSQDPAILAEVERRRPWWIKLHRLVGVPLRTLRRQLLVWLRVRTTGGSVESEYFAEHALVTERAMRPTVATRWSVLTPTLSGEARPS